MRRLDCVPVAFAANIELPVARVPSLLVLGELKILPRAKVPPADKYRKPGKETGAPIVSPSPSLHEVRFFLV